MDAQSSAKPHVPSELNYAVQAISVLNGWVNTVQGWSQAGNAAMQQHSVASMAKHLFCSFAASTQAEIKP
ncbi:hypothetical protein D3C77_763130 [compost metagenome]